MAMSENNVYTTAYAVTVSQIKPTELDTFVPAIDSVLRVVKIEDITYGLRHIQRSIAKVDESLNIGTQFDPKNSKDMQKVVQSLDLACIYDRRTIKKVDYAGDVANVQKHVAAFGKLFIEGWEALLMAGCADPVVRGILDYTNATAGTKERPEQVPPVTGLNWGGPEHLEGNVIEASTNLYSKGFRADTIIIPENLRAVISKLITSTSTSIKSWIIASGYNIVFSKYVDTDATAAAFDVAVIDSSRVGLASTPIDLTSFYSNEEHGFAWDGESYPVPIFDPLFKPGVTVEAGEWFKGVCMITACSFST